MVDKERKRLQFWFIAPGEAEWFHAKTQRLRRAAERGRRSLSLTTCQLLNLSTPIPFFENFGQRSKPATGP
jgi:hypothetical protein